MLLEARIQSFGKLLTTSLSATMPFNCFETVTALSICAFREGPADAVGQKQDLTPLLQIEIWRLTF